MVKMDLQMFGGRGGGSGMSSSTSGGSGFMNNQRNMEDYAVAVGMFDRDFMRTADGQAALREFMEDEKEAGLTEQEMRQAIQDTGSRSSGGTGGSRGTNNITSGGSAYQVNDIPKRIQSFTTTGTDASGNPYESKTYVTKNGDAIKTTTKYSDGTRMTSTDAQNYSQYPQYNKTRAQYEETLSGMAKGQIRTGSKVTAVNDKKKGLSQASRDTLRNIEQGARQRQRRNETNRRSVRRGMGL